MSVFISYAKEDRDTALSIYDGLSSRGLSPWIDVRNLLPGQTWEIEIRKAIRHSSVFLACLSSRSVQKRGYVQSELKRAVEVLETMPEGQVFVIPVRLDECDVPTTLERLHWVDYFTPEGPTKLLEAISVYVGGNRGAGGAEAKVQFARIAIDGRNSYWGEKPLGQHRSPFRKEGKQYFTLTEFVRGADPSFDVSLLNMSTQPIMLLAIGIEVVRVAQISYLAGIPRAARVPLQDWYVLEMPELRNEIRTETEPFSKVLPRDVNRLVSMNLRDPLYMEPKAPYRYVLLLNGYDDRMPNHVIMRLWVNSNLGEHRSHDIEIFTG